MSIRDLIPFKQLGKKNIPAKRGDIDPFVSLHREIDRIFENFSRGFLDFPMFSKGMFTQQAEGDFIPSADVTEDEKNIRVTMELPGMDENDVHVSLTQNELVVRGEKLTEHEDKGKEKTRSERLYGSFYRSVPLPDTIDGNKADASFKKGVLIITIPKKEQAQKQTKTIPVRRA